MNKEVLDNHRKYLERADFYRGSGYDQEKERDLIVDRSLPVQGKILEIGTGRGHFALALARRGFSFLSIDISAEEQKIARLNLRYFGMEKRVTFRIENAEKLSFPDRGFDVIFSVNVFHHLEKPRAVLDEINRLLGPGGKTVLSDFNARGLDIINRCHEREGRTHDYFRHRLEEAAGYFLRKGFIINEFQSEVQKMIVAVKKELRT